jgi:hypothetical protein
VEVLQAEDTPGHLGDAVKRNGLGITDISRWRADETGDIGRMDEAAEVGGLDLPEMGVPGYHGEGQQVY